MRRRARRVATAAALAALAVAAAAGPARAQEPDGSAASAAPAAAPAVADTAAARDGGPPPRPGAGPPLISPTRAVLATPLFPGWGQLYARSGWRAVLAWGATGYYGAHLVRNDRRAVRWQERSRTLPADGVARAQAAAYALEFREKVRDYAWWELGALLIIALDAYVDAHLYGFDRDPVPVPDRWDDADAGGAGAAAPDIAGVVFVRWDTRF